MNESGYTIGACRKLLADELSGIYPVEEIRSLTSVILRNLTGLPLSKLLTSPERMIGRQTWVKINEICDFLKDYQPIQYILGETEFMGYTFRVGPGVLIPRPETEELADLVIRENPDPDLAVIDIGTGSGAIAISLAMGMNSPVVTATDTDDTVLEIASVNNRLIGAGIRLIKDDILNPSHNHPVYDIIISNPPYIRESEKHHISANVINYEPHSALFVPDNDPLIFYRAILSFADSSLVSSGKIYFEINETLGNEMFNLVEKYNYGSIRIIEDINGKERILAAIKNG